MKTSLFLTLLFCTLLFSTAVAQIYTETFESISGPGKPVTFTNNGQSFTVVTATPGGSLGGLFGAYIPMNSWTMPNPGGGPTANTTGGFGVGTSCTSGNCSGVSDKFLDNGLSSGTGQAYSVKTTDGRLFSMKNIHLFFSADNGNNNIAPANVTIKGKKSGATIFTIIKTAGFISGFATNNGFNYINFTTEGGVDNSNTPVDEIEFTCHATVNYFAVDNFTWGPVVATLPLQLLDFSGKAYENKTVLTWQTAHEINIHHFELQFSSNNSGWQIVNAQKGENSNSINNYSYTHFNPAVQGFYRLKIVDNNGSFTISNVLSFTPQETGKITAYYKLSDNEVIIKLPHNKTAYAQFITSNGAVIKSQQLNSTVTSINTNNFPKGIFFIKVVQEQNIKVVKMIKS